MQKKGKGKEGKKRGGERKERKEKKGREREGKKRKMKEKGRINSGKEKREGTHKDLLGWVMKGSHIERNEKVIAKLLDKFDASGFTQRSKEGSTRKDLG